jgi:hypothetical protein
MSREEAARIQAAKWRARAAHCLDEGEREIFRMLHRNWEFIAASYELLDAAAKQLQAESGDGRQAGMAE